MRWTLLAACAAIAATLWLPGEAAEPTARVDGAAAAATTATTSTVEEAITFDAYREWRLNYIERRRSELAVQLSHGDLPAARRGRIEQTKAYYDWFAGLAAADRDSRFRARFDRIDTNHDGKLDAERTAWRDKQRAFYHHDRVAATPAPAEDAKP